MRKLYIVAIAMLVLTVALMCAPASTGSRDATSLIDAVKAGNLPAVRKLLQQRSNVNESEADGTTALHWGVQKDRLDIAQALIAAGANVNAKNNYGLTPLAWALDNANAAMAEQLLKAGANPRVWVPERGKALFAAARTGNPDVIKALLKAGVKVNETEPETGQTALMWAAAEGHEMAVKVLLAAGADTRARSSDDETALFFAVRRGDIGTVDALLSAGADVNERATQETDANGRTLSAPGDSMLVVAIVNAHFRLADFLLTKGADPNAAGSRWTPLHELSRARNYEESQYPPAVIASDEMDSLELGQRLLAHGAKPNARALTTTVRRNTGDQNYLDLIGATPFFLAAKSGDVPYMRLLLSGGADPALALDDHTSPLMVAAGIGCVPGQWIEPEHDILAAVKVLVEELNADVNAANDHNETALHGAVCRGADSVIQYLANSGAKFNIKDADGQTPLDIAMDGLFRPTRINGPRIIYFRFSDHTIALVKKFTEDQRSANPDAKTAVRRREVRNA